MTAVQEQDAAGVRARLEAGDAVDERDSYGQTALHWAAKYESAEIVKLLIEAGADVRSRDADGDMPMDNARRSGHEAVIAALERAKPAPRPKQPQKPSKGAATRQKAAPARPKQQSNTGWIVVGAVAVVVLIAVIVATMSAGGSSDATEVADVAISGQVLPALPEDPTAPDPAAGLAMPEITGVSFDDSPVSITNDGNAKVIIYLAHW
jgi:hypothetical protein